MTETDTRRLAWLPFDSVPYAHRLATTIHPPVGTWVGETYQWGLEADQRREDAQQGLLEPSQRHGTFLPGYKSLQSHAYVWDGVTQVPIEVYMRPFGAY